MRNLCKGGFLKRQLVSYVLHLRSETIAIHRWINIILDDHDGQLISGG